MKLDLSADRALFNRKRNKSQQSIFQLSLLATEARTGIDENQQLTTTISILKRMVEKNKIILKKLTSYSNISKEEVEKGLEEGKKELILLNKNLKGERNLIKLKYNKTKNEIKQTLSNPKTELDIVANRKFIYENTLIQKEAIIRKIKIDLRNLLRHPYPLVKEEVKELYFNMPDDEYLDMLDREQAELMLECKSFNKYQNKSILLFDNKKLLLNEIQKFKNHENSDKNLIEEKIYEYIEKINNEDSILNESISSIYEDDLNNIQFPIVINNKHIIEKNNLNKQFKFPKLSLEQIMYNKKRFKPEDAEKSLSRIIKKPSSKDIKIKKLKEDIKKLKKKNESKLLRCKEFSAKIKKMESIINGYTFINENNDNIKTEISIC